MFHSNIQIWILFTGIEITTKAQRRMYYTNSVNICLFGKCFKSRGKKFVHLFVSLIVFFSQSLSLSLCLSSRVPLFIEYSQLKTDVDVDRHLFINPLTVVSEIDCESIQMGNICRRKLKPMPYYRLRIFFCFFFAIVIKLPILWFLVRR